MPAPESRMEGHSKLKIGRKEAHDTGDPCSEFEKSDTHTLAGGWKFWCRQGCQRPMDE